jgi:hypothetical protein
MAVYMDDVRFPFGRMIMCHMWADSLDELLAMADRIGLARRWLQQPPKASWIHFDVSLSLKARAIEAGAILTDRYGAVYWEQSNRLNHSHAPIRERARMMVDRIDRLRARGATVSVNCHQEASDL